MSYLSQIDIESVKEWLKIDGNELNGILSLMVANACITFEKETQHIISQQTKSVKAGERVYFYPIADLTSLEAKSNYYVVEADIDIVVGYAPNCLPDEIKAVILTMVEAQYFARENDDVVSYPPIVGETMKRLRRFIF